MRKIKVDQPATWFCVLDESKIKPTRQPYIAEEELEITINTKANPNKITTHRFGNPAFAPANFTPVKFARLKFAPRISQPLKSASAKSVPRKLPPRKDSPRKSRRPFLYCSITAAAFIAYEIAILCPQSYYKSESGFL
jgi:hypothetical protein